MEIDFKIIFALSLVFFATYYIVSEKVTFVARKLSNYFFLNSMAVLFEICSILIWKDFSYLGMAFVMFSFIDIFINYKKTVWVLYVLMIFIPKQEKVH